MYFKVYYSFTSLLLKNKDVFTIQKKKFGCGDGYKLYGFNKTCQSVYLKYVNSVVCKLYLNKVVEDISAING